MARIICAVSLVDGAQSLPHSKVHVQSLGCDFFTFSGHKIFATTCIGAPYGRSDLVDSMSPWQGDGSMIKDVTFTKTTYAGLPTKFEAVTGSLAVAFVSAQRLTLNTLDLQATGLHESALLAMAIDALLVLPGCSIIGQARQKAEVLLLILMVSLYRELLMGLTPVVMPLDRGIIALKLFYTYLVWRSLHATHLHFTTVLKM